MAPNILGAVTAALAAVILVGIITVTPADSPSIAPEYSVPLAWIALSVLLIIFLVALSSRGMTVRLGRFFPWIVGVASFVVSFIPWYFVLGANTELGARMYQGMKVPQGIYQFWDLSLILQSVDCSRWGFDIYAENNGCLQDPSIYAPGTTWWRIIPGLSDSNVTFLGVMAMLLSSVMLLWLARHSRGLGQIVLLVAAFGGPWLLLLERGNLDAVVMWVAVAVVALTRRYPNLGVWALAATLIWIVGTWKYYPFALGVLLLPVILIKRGWIILVGFIAATAAFMLLTWSNFVFSTSSNEGMVDYGDFVVLGRIPVVARMVADFRAADSLGVGDLLFYALALTALVWGVVVARTITLRQVSRIQSVTYLALGGAGLYLASVLVSGFGYGYKAVFLLLAVPLLSRFTAHRDINLVRFSVLLLLLVALQSVVVWNTAMVTIAGVMAASGSAGFSATVVVRGLRARNSSHGQHTVGVPTA